MRRIRITAVLGAAVLGVTIAGPAGPVRAQESPAPSDAEVVAQADAAIEENPEAVRRSEGDEYRVWRVIRSGTGGAHVRYTRDYHGVPVVGGDFVVHLDPEGGFTGASVSLDQPITVDTEPQLPADEAVQVVQEELRVSPEGEPELVVAAATEEPRLAWRVPATGDEGGVTVLVDAAQGEILQALPDHQEVTGTGHSVYGGTVPLETLPIGGLGHKLVDPTRGFTKTCDLNHAWSGTCSIFTDPDNIWGNHNPAFSQSAAVDAHYGAAMTFDYYQAVHGRAGVFGTGAGVTSRVHRGVSWSNARWLLGAKVMEYGDGAGGIRPLVSLDVVGHEMTHGVNQAIIPPNGLIYSGESGGLNEATSDIFGTMVEFYAANPSDPPDYLIAETVDIWGTGTPLRYLHDPAQDGQSPNCWSPGVGSLNVHFSSGIGNHFFFLLAQGSGSTPYGFSPTCNSQPAVGIGRTKAAAIWYRALEAYFTSAESYADARRDTLLAAAELYGRCSGEWFAVARAWAAVQVPGFRLAPCYQLRIDIPILVKWPEFPIPDPGPWRWDVQLERPGELPGLEVGVNIMHPRRGDLQIDLVAPDGEEYRLKDADPDDAAADVTEFFDVELAEPAQAGVWELMVTDLVEGGAGEAHVLGWTLVY